MKGLVFLDKILIRKKIEDNKKSFRNYLSFKPESI